LIALALQRIDHTRNGLESLRDGRGIYGLDFRLKRQEQSSAAIIRPDKFRRHGSRVALQPVPSKLRRLFRGTETNLADDLHRVLFEQSARLDGLDPEQQWGGDDDSERLRKKWHGCRSKAYRITNSLIRQLLAEAADQRALRQARRYRLRERQHVYFLASRSDRLSQLCDTFPLLAPYMGSELLELSGFADFAAEDVIAAVQAGWPLRQIAAMMGVPYVMRAVPPLAVIQAWPFRDLFRRNPHLINRMPRGDRAAAAWFDVLYRAKEVSPDFAEWCAKRIEIRPPYGRAAIEVTNIGDWVRASYEKHIQAAIDDLAEKLEREVPAEYVRHRLNDPLASGGGSALVTRTSKPDMSARTVYQLSEVWHDVVADQRFSGNSMPFPKARAPSAEIGGYEIIPLDTPLDLYLEGKAMHNCVATYEGHVRAGACYLFGMRKGGAPIATIEIQAASDGFHLAQFAGPCNQPVSKSVERIIRKWARRAKFAREKPALPAGMEWVSGDDLDAEIPF